MVRGVRLQVSVLAFSFSSHLLVSARSSGKVAPSGGSKHRYAMFAGDKTMSCYALQAKQNIKSGGFSAGLYVLLTLMPAICGIILVDI